MLVSHVPPPDTRLASSLCLSFRVLGNILPYHQQSDASSDSIGGLSFSPATAFHQPFAVPLSFDEAIFSPHMGLTSPSGSEPSNFGNLAREGFNHAFGDQGPYSQSRQALTPQVVSQGRSASACNCHATALSTLSSLNADLEATSTLSFNSRGWNAILATCRHAITICETSGSCQRCPKTVMLMLCTAILQRVAICYETLSSNSGNHSIPFSIRMGEMDFSDVASNPSIMQAVIQGEKKRAQNVCEGLQVESRRFRKSTTSGNRPAGPNEGVGSEELTMLLKVTREKFVPSFAIERAV